MYTKCDFVYMTTLICTRKWIWCTYKSGFGMDRVVDEMVNGRGWLGGLAGGIFVEIPPKSSWVFGGFTGNVIWVTIGHAS